MKPLWNALVVAGAALTIVTLVGVPLLPDSVLNPRGLALKHAVRGCLP